MTASKGIDFILLDTLDGPDEINFLWNLLFHAKKSVQFVP